MSPFSKLLNKIPGASAAAGAVQQHYSAQGQGHDDDEDADAPSGGAQKKLAVPKYPDQVILPRPPIPPPQMSHTTLRQICDKLLNAEPFSVTKSPMVCPIGAGANELYTVKPYWWNEGGKWVRRDGQKNPGEFVGQF